jgi:hypothetical protein
LGDTNDALGDVDIADLQPDDLAGAQAAAVKSANTTRAFSVLATASRHLVASGLVMRCPDPAQ